MFDIVEDDDDLVAELENADTRIGVPVLANKELHKEETDYRNLTQEEEDNFPIRKSPGKKAVSKKRKQTKILRSPKCVLQISILDDLELCTIMS